MDENDVLVRVWKKNAVRSALVEHRAV